MTAATATAGSFDNNETIIDTHLKPLFNRAASGAREMGATIKQKAAKAAENDWIKYATMGIGGLMTLAMAPYVVNMIKSPIESAKSLTFNLLKFTGVAAAALYIGASMGTWAQRGFKLDEFFDSFGDTAKSAARLVGIGDDKKVPVPPGPEAPKPE